MKRWLLLALFCSTGLAQQYEVYAIRYAEIPRSAIRSPRSAARDRGTRNPGCGPRFNVSGRVHLIDGDQEILPGVRAYTGGRHTFASQHVSAPTHVAPRVVRID